MFPDPFSDPPLVGPSRPNATSLTSSSSRLEGHPVLDYGHADSSFHSTHKKRHKRARKACFQCRSRKRKCGGTSSVPCPMCVADDLVCTWPTEDGRSLRFKRTSAQRRKPPILKGSPSFTTDWMDESAIGQHMMIDAVEAKDETPRYGALHSIDDYVSQMQGLFPAGEGVNTDPYPPPLWSDGYDPSGLSPSDPQHQVEQLFVPGLESSDFQWPSGIDSASVIFAMSSQMPMIDKGHQGTDDPGTPADTTAVQPLQNWSLLNLSPKDERQDEAVKIIWWRPHGHTAIAPGLKRITLKVRVNRPEQYRQTSSPSSSNGCSDPSEVIGPGGMPHPVVMKHLLGLFMDHFGCQFPSLGRGQLEEEIDKGTGSIFLFNCIACTAARFSNHPVIALPDMEPHDYGNVFLKVARDLLGSMLSVPSRETVLALVLLAGISHGIDSESEEWMMTGMAARMAVDLGLHLDPGETSDISKEERRLNRLTLWSVCMLDCSLSFGTGRETALRIESITQSLPTDEDMGLSPDEVRSPFPAAAAQMLTYGPLINVLNGPHDSAGQWMKDAQTSIRRAVSLYSALPADMQWSVSNFQNQSRRHQGSIFLEMHLWMHTVISSTYLTDIDVRRPDGVSAISGIRSGTMTPTSLASTNLWHNSARTIGDILVLSDIIDPFAYHALPFVNQAFFVAGSCYIKEVEQQQKQEATSMLSSNQMTTAEDRERQAELYRALLKSVASNNISVLQQGLAKQTKYWSGVAWVAEALEQRLSGVEAGEIDLAAVTDKLSSFVSVPDAGLLPHGLGQRLTSLNIS